MEAYFDTSDFRMGDPLYNSVSTDMTVCLYVCLYVKRQSILVIILIIDFPILYQSTDSCSITQSECL